MLKMMMAWPNTDRFFAEIQVMTQRGRIDRSDDRVTNRGKERVSQCGVLLFIG
jgi:hypothetical protein